MLGRKVSHNLLDASRGSYDVGKVVCVGRNYVGHAQELNNPVPDTPILFIKPTTAVVDIKHDIVLPKDKGICHHEVEIAVLIGREISCVDASEANAAIAGLGVALDLTLRDLQDSLKAKGQPWEVAKAFDGSCPMSDFVLYDNTIDLTQLEIRLAVNGVVKQAGKAIQMLFPILELISYISTIFTLLPGDVVLTGTPQGVGALRQGDNIEVELVNQLRCKTRII